MKRMVLLLLMLALLFVGSSVADGAKTKEEIKFNNIDWLSSKDVVYESVKQLYPDIEIIIDEEEESEYTDKIIHTYVTYVNSETTGGGYFHKEFGKVGSFKIEKISALFTRNSEHTGEDQLYSIQYSLNVFDYTGHDRALIKELLEMLIYKYGEPYTSQEQSGSRINLHYTWLSENEDRAIEFRYYYYDDGLPHASCYLTYYMPDLINEEETAYDLYQQQKKEEEMSNKDYTGI